MGPVEWLYMCDGPSSSESSWLQRLTVHSLISSRFDSCNALLINLPEYQLNRIQCLQNLLVKQTSHIFPHHWQALHVSSSRFHSDSTPFTVHLLHTVHAVLNSSTCTCTSPDSCAHQTTCSPKIHAPNNHGGTVLTLDSDKKTRS